MPQIAPRRQKCQLTATVAVRWPGATPTRPRALLGIRLHPVSGAQRGGPGLIQPESIGEAHPAQTVGGRDPSAACLHPTPAPRCAWRLLVAGRFLLLGGYPESPHAARRSSVQGLWVRSSRDASSRPSWSPGLPHHKRHLLPPLWPARTLRAIPGDCLVLPLCLPCLRAHIKGVLCTLPHF